MQMVRPLESIAETQRQLHRGSLELSAINSQCFREALRHHRQSEMIAVTAFVARLVLVVVDDKNRAID